MRTLHIAVSLVVTFLFVFSKPSIAAPVTAADESWHNMGANFTFGYEWYYFDVQTTDGSQLVFAFLGPNFFDLDGPSLKSGIQNHVGVVVELAQPGKAPVLAFDYLRDNQALSFTPSPFKVQIGNSTLTMTQRPGDYRDYVIDLNLTSPATQTTFQAHLQYTGTLPGWKHNDGKFFKASDGSYHEWVVAEPRADVNGWYSYSVAAGPETKVNVTSHDGYHDHNWGTIGLWQSEDGWIWGRALAGDKTVIYYLNFGKDRADYPGEAFYVNNGSSGLYVASPSDGVLLDSNNVNVDYGTPENLQVLPNGMTQFKVLKLSVANSIFNVQINSPDQLTIPLPYYYRQASQMTLSCEDSLCSSETGLVLNEQMDFPTFISEALATSP